MKEFITDVNNLFEPRVRTKINNDCAEREKEVQRRSKPMGVMKVYFKNNVNIARLLMIFFFVAFSILSLYFLEYKFVKKCWEVIFLVFSLVLIFKAI